MARMRFSLVAATATIAAFAAPTTALAATTDCEGLQDALDNPANTVVTLDQGAVCIGHFDLPSRAITLEGAGSGATLDGVGESQILSGDSVGTTTIRNLTFVNGRAFEDDGGAIQISGSSSPTISGNKFFSNQATDGGDGGAVNVDVDDLNQHNLRGSDGPVVLRGNTFGGPEQANVADSDGGAVYIEARFRSVTLDGNTFTGNEAGEDGGGAAVNTCRAEITDNVFTSNRISGSSNPDGGGLFLSGNSCFATLSRGDAVPSLQTNNRFRGNVISGADSERSFSHGAGEAIENLDVVSTNDRYVGNTIEDVTSGSGGGLSYRGFIGTLVARNLVATGNEITTVPPEEGPERGLAFGENRGGGVFLGSNNQGTEFEIADSTIEGNTALEGSGIAQEEQRAGLARSEVESGDRLLLFNSIVFGNTGASDSAGDAFDGEIDGFFETRDVRSSDVCVGGAVHAGTGNVCVDPKLKTPSADENVDQTSASPTIDAGDNALVHGDLDKDYAGDGRKLGARVDMGADEYKPATVVEPGPEPTVQPPAAAAPQGAVQGQTQRSCKSKRSFRIRIRVPKGKHARSAVVRVNNKKVTVVRGKRLRAPVRLRGLPKGKFTVKITVRLTNGKQITGKRTYHTCIPKLPGDGPPRV